MNPSVSTLNKTIAEAIPEGGSRYDAGYRDALESILLALDADDQVQSSSVQNAVTTALDAFGNNAEDDDDEVAHSSYTFDRARGVMIDPEDGEEIATFHGPADVGAQFVEMINRAGLVSAQNQRRYMAVDLGVLTLVVDGQLNTEPRWIVVDTQAGEHAPDHRLGDAGFYSSSAAANKVIEELNLFDYAKTVEGYWALQKEAEHIDLQIAKGQDAPELDARLELIRLAMEDSGLTIDPDSGRVVAADHAQSSTQYSPNH